MHWLVERMRMVFLLLRVPSYLSMLDLAFEAYLSPHSPAGAT